MDRREFLKSTGAAALTAATAQGAGRPVAIEIGKDAVAQSAPVQWALGELKKAVTVRDDAPFRIGITGVPEAGGAGVVESFAMIPSANRLTLRASDARG